MARAEQPTLPDVSDVLERESLAERVAKALMEDMSPAGALPHLPPILEKRRLEYGIPDAALKRAAMWSTILLWQIHLEHQKDETTKGGIIKPETRHRGERAQSPRAIIVSAGLEAMDYLRDHGSGIGHIVNIMNLSPYRLSIGEYAGMEISLLSCQARQIFEDEDLGNALKAGTVKMSAVDGKHVYTDADGHPIAAKPSHPAFDEGEW